MSCQVRSGHVMSCHVSLFVCMYVYVFSFVYLFNLRLYICIYVHIYIYTCIWICIYLFIFIYMYLNNKTNQVSNPGFHHICAPDLVAHKKTILHLLRYIFLLTSIHWGWESSSLYVGVWVKNIFRKATAMKESLARKKIQKRVSWNPRCKRQSKDRKTQTKQHRT